MGEDWISCRHRLVNTPSGLMLGLERLSALSDGWKKHISTLQVLTHEKSEQGTRYEGKLTLVFSGRWNPYALTLSCPDTICEDIQ